MERRIGLILCCFVSTLAWGQQTAGVSIIVEGQLPASLSAADLKVESGHLAVTVTSVTSLATERLQYVVLNDSSGGTLWRGGTAQQARVIDDLLQSVVVSGTDIGTLVNFSDAVYLDTQNEGDPRKLSAKLERTGRGGTALYDAVVSTANWLRKQPLVPGHRKIMFLFCDGQDNMSKRSLDNAIEVLQRAGSPAFIFAPSSSEDKKQGRKLQQLADDSGGRVFFVPGDTQRVNFDLLKDDLARSFRVQLTVPSDESAMYPLTITDVANPQVHIVAPSRFCACH